MQNMPQSAATDGDADHREHEARDEGAHDSDDDVSDQPKAIAFHELPCQPAGHPAYDQEYNKIHGFSFRRRTARSVRGSHCRTTDVIDRTTRRIMRWLIAETNAVRLLVSTHVRFMLNVNAQALTFVFTVCPGATIPGRVDAEKNGEDARFLWSVLIPLTGCPRKEFLMLRVVIILSLLVLAQKDATASSVREIRRRLILDADTANEIDDMYAIVRMMKQDQFQVLALTSTQWIHYLTDNDSVVQSQRENETLVKLLGRNGLPTPMGSREPMGKPWGGEQPKDSPAARAIIKAAREASPDDKLVVVCLGATTNLASAIKLAPEIAANIEAHVLGFKYDFEKHVWNKSSFNTRRDLNAADFVLNCRALELFIMPSNVARPLTFSQSSTFVRHKKMGALGRHLTDKWKARFADFPNWIMWDLALVEAILKPQLATTVKVTTPPENEQRLVTLYQSVQVQAMRDDYWSVALPDPQEAAWLRNATADELLATFEPYPEKCDLLVVVAHPDDEGYFAGLMPWYSVGRSKKVIVVSLTSGEWGNGLPHHKLTEDTPDYSYDDSDYPRYPRVPADAVYPCYFREQEMMRAMHVYGVRYAPVMPRFKDMSGLSPWGLPEPAFALWGGREETVGFLVSLIRRFRPDVVVTLPTDGNNGNPQHCAASAATRFACERSGDPRQFPKQLAEHEVWAPRKLYLQVSEKQQSEELYSDVHEHSWELKTTAMKRTARQMGALGNAQHASQEMKEECPEKNFFVLIQSNVGEDVKRKNDLFEHIN